MDVLDLPVTLFLASFNHTVAIALSTMVFALVSEKPINDIMFFPLRLNSRPISIIKGESQKIVYGQVPASPRFNSYLMPSTGRCYCSENLGFGFSSRGIIEGNMLFPVRLTSLPEFTARGESQRILYELISGLTSIPLLSNAVDVSLLSLFCPWYQFLFLRTL